MKTPTDSEMSQYREKLAELRALGRANEPTDDAEKELTAFMRKTGIANEAPATDFPELANKDKS